jgi:hypothetical protein
VILSRAFQTQQSPSPASSSWVISSKVAFERDFLESLFAQQNH